MTEQNIYMQLVLPSTILANYTRMYHTVSAFRPDPLVCLDTESCLVRMLSVGDFAGTESSHGTEAEQHTYKHLESERPVSFDDGQFDVFTDDVDQRAIQQHASCDA